MAKFTLTIEVVTSDKFHADLTHTFQHDHAGNPGALALCGPGITHLATCMALDAISRAAATVMQEHGPAEAGSSITASLRIPDDPDNAMEVELFMPKPTTTTMAEPPTETRQ